MDPQASYIKEEPSKKVDEIVLEAIQKGASDIHFDPERESLNIRYRIDGVVYPAGYLDTYQQEAITTRIKVISGIKITEHRIPQDGHFEFKLNEKVYNIRVSTLPTTYGETIVMRIFNREDILIDLANLGMEEDQLSEISKLIATPSGMIVITGPTGSGKTNLLYSILNSINKEDKNIITIEDPIEYQMPIIRQVQINEDTGLDFPHVMRSVVRQDPDVVMIGEIRDKETAQMAVSAALTGVLILSTFHTFDVPALVSRLIEMGLSNTNIAQSIKAVISTRLVRKICPACKTSDTPNELEKKLLGANAATPIYQGKGCNACQNRRYLGRTGIFEIVSFDDDLRASIIERRPVIFINELLKKKVLKSLHVSGLNKVFSGITSMEEFIRVVGYSHL